MFDLKIFRENCLKMTQDELAKFIGEPLEKISRIEQKIEDIPLNIFLTIASKTGMTPDQLSQYEKPVACPINPEDTWQQTKFTKRTIVDYIEQGCAANATFWGDDYHSFIDGLRKGISAAVKKPKVALIGRSDVGKSAMINAIIGTEKMPTSWTPTTSIVVYLKHISDRPSYIEDEAWVFKAGKDASESWDDSRLSDEAYCRQWKIAGGTADILSSYGVRQGKHFATKEAGAAVIFVESEVLKNCDIIDLPGFGTGDRNEDDAITLNAKKAADVLIYLSIANGFMREEDIQYIKESISSLNIIEQSSEVDIPPLSNLFIVASQAHTVSNGNVTSLNDILDLGCERFEKTLPEGYWARRSSVSKKSYGHDVLKSRFFTYTTDIEHLRAKFESELKKILELLPRLINVRIKDFVRIYAEQSGIRLDIEIRTYTEMCDEREKYIKLLKEIEAHETERANDNQNRRMGIFEKIRTYKADSIDRFASEYGTLITVDNIVKIMKDRKVEKKKDDVQAFSSYLSSVLEERVQSILETKSAHLSKDIDDYLKVFASSHNIISSSDNPAVTINGVEFNVKRAFASGLAGLATFAGLAFWAGSLGNLGAYILVAEGVSLLSAVGISIGGTAAAVSSVAAIGGPVVLGIALAIIAALSVFAIFSGGWEKSVAKKLVNAYDEQDALMRFKDCIETFWDQTEIAFSAAADSLENEWAGYVDNLSTMISEYDIEAIKHKIAVARSIKNFFEHIPL
ncbi:GTP-binding protein EngB [Desulfosporosinus acididurans]|uniref:GTP-binding protein EngB n=1 Tax=Desulfosporosinus acididurans TaxID=476652 RepID=A0A0J1FNC0_9FIRM|nr:helix-turn-helix transcriptional regulator [Desulfosporosinus acididurans]KLU64453.1 GTP-binding protein EngB [Desulfosporosinus acididurans]